VAQHGFEGVRVIIVECDLLLVCLLSNIYQLCLLELTSGCARSYCEIAVWATQFVEVCRFLAEDEAMRVDLAVGEFDQHVTEFRLVEEPLVWSALSQVFGLL
jgi:hypothetical protein